MNRVTWLGHSTVVIEIDGTRLITDPALRSRIWHLRRPEAVSATALGELDGVLVSHAHFDHLDLGSLDKLDRSLPVVVPREAGELVRRRGFARVLEVAAGDELDLDSLRIRATHAEHASGRGPFSPQSSALGYVVTGSAAVYFAGDTDLFDGMAELGPLDLALLPVSRPRRFGCCAREPLCRSTGGRSERLLRRDTAPRRPVISLGLRRWWRRK